MSILNNSIRSEFTGNPRAESQPERYSEAPTALSLFLDKTNITERTYLEANILEIKSALDDLRRDIQIADEGMQKMAISSHIFFIRGCLRRITGIFSKFAKEREIERIVLQYIEN